jgi:transposase
MYGTFGPRLQAWAGQLGGADRLSKPQVSRLSADLLDLSISTGLVAKLQRRAAEVLAGPMAEILRAIHQAGAVHADETSWRERYKKVCLRAGSTNRATAFQAH